MPHTLKKVFTTCLDIACTTKQIIISYSGACARVQYVVNEYASLLYIDGGSRRHIQSVVLSPMLGHLKTADFKVFQMSNTSVSSCLCSVSLLA